MNFRLIYNGALKAASQSETRRREKHEIRMVFHRQLKQLMGHKNVLREEVDRVSSRVLDVFDDLENFKRGDFRFLPIVRESMHLVCDLDILFLRRESPGSLIGGGGDIDNRLKTLFDALRVPQDENEIRDLIAPPQALVYCVTEDDKLITGFRVTTDRLLEPANTEAEQNNVQLVVNVEIKVTKLTEENLGYISHF